MALLHLEQVLQAAGLAPDQTKALVELKDDATDFKPDTFVAPITTAVETKVKNDPKFYEAITKETLTTHNPKLIQDLEAAQYGRAASIVRTNMLKAAGLSDADFKELGEEGKKIEVFTTAFAKKLSDGKISDKELQQKLIEATTKVEELTGKMPELEKQYKTQADQTVAERTFDLIMLNQLARVKDLKVNPDLIVNRALADFKGEHSFHVDGMNAEPRQKDKADLKVLVNNKPLSLTDWVQSWVAKNELTAQKTGGKAGSTTVETTGDGKLVVTGSVNDKISDRIKQDAVAANGTT